MFTFLVLDTNMITETRKSDETLSDIFDKFQEEAGELLDAINENNINHILEEAFDTQQVIIGLLNKFKNDGIDLHNAVYTHNMKLLDRGWTYSDKLHIRGEH